jgi:transposase-like protein
MYLANYAELITARANFYAEAIAPVISLQPAQRAEAIRLYLADYERIDIAAILGVSCRQVGRALHHTKRPRRPHPKTAAIIEMLANNEGVRPIARHLGISQGTVTRVRDGL